MRNSIYKIQKIPSTKISSQRKKGLSHDGRTIYFEHTNQIKLSFTYLYLHGFYLFRCQHITTLILYI